MYEEVVTLHRLLAENETVGEGMSRLLDAWAAADPDVDYGPFCDLPYDEEVERLATEWFEPLVKRSPPASSGIAALWLVLVESEGESGDFYDKTGDFYLAGSDEFELDREYDWKGAVIYRPEGHMAGDRVISDFYRTMLEADENYGEYFEYLMCTAFVAFALRRLLRDVDPKLIVSGTTPVQVIVGYERGDAIYPGVVTPQGFVPRDPAEVEARLIRENESSEREFEQALRDYRLRN